MQCKQLFVGATAILVTFGILNKLKQITDKKSRPFLRPAYRNNHPEISSFNHSEAIDRIVLSEIEVLSAHDSKIKEKSSNLDLCIPITTSGSWTNWKEFKTDVPHKNFSIFKHDDTGMRYHDNAWSNDYKFSWPPWLNWRDQNYQGTWATNSLCELYEFDRRELQMCFEHGKGVIQVIGDSIGRQLWRSLLMRLQGDLVFNDTQLYKTSIRRSKINFDSDEHFETGSNRKQNSDESGFLHFFWSQSFRDESCKKCSCGQCIAAIDEALLPPGYNYTKRLPKQPGMKTKLVRERSFNRRKNVYIVLNKSHGLK